MSPAWLALGFSPWQLKWPPWSQAASSRFLECLAAVRRTKALGWHVLADGQPYRLDKQILAITTSGSNEFPEFRLGRGASLLCPAPLPATLILALGGEKRLLSMPHHAMLCHAIPPHPFFPSNKRAPGAWAFLPIGWIAPPSNVLLKAGGQSCTCPPPNSVQPACFPSPPPRVPS